MIYALNNLVELLMFFSCDPTLNVYSIGEARGHPGATEGHQTVTGDLAAPDGGFGRQPSSRAG